METWNVEVRNQEVAFDTAIEKWDFPSRDQRRAVRRGEYVTIEVWATSSLRPTGEKCFMLTLEVTAKLDKGNHIEYIGRLVRHAEVPESFMMAMPTGTMVTFHDDHIRTVSTPSTLDDLPPSRNVKTVVTSQSFRGATFLDEVAGWDGGTVLYCGAEPMLALPPESTIDPQVVAALLNQLFGPFTLKPPKKRPKDF